MKALAPLGLFLLCLPFAAGCSKVTPVKLEGFVQSSKMDENDNPVEIFLWDGKAGYPIEDNKNKEELLEKLDTKIEAEADLREGYRGKKTIEIKSYRILQEANE